MGVDGRPRYLILETLRAYGAGRLTEAGERPEAAAALARHALEVAGQTAAALETSEGELAAIRWLDAEDAALHQALGWALEHDPDTALQLAIAPARPLDHRLPAACRSRRARRRGRRARRGASRSSGWAC